MNTATDQPRAGVLKSLAMALAMALGTASAAEPTLTLDLGGGVSLGLVLIVTGEFTQGSPAGEAGRAPDETPRTVRLTQNYYMASSPVTRAQWERFVAATGYRSEAEVGTSGGFGWDGTALVQRKDFTWRNPGFPQAADHPVCLLTFPDAEAFCRWLSRQARRVTTLPTEAQWEYACRAGTTTAFHAGDAASDADRVAWHHGNSGNRTHSATQLLANPWGLWIGGNVAEWCLDWYAPYPPGPVTDPCQTNPNLSEKPRRVLRGGSWLKDPKNTRSAARYRADPRSRNADTGFRVVCAVDAVPPPPPQAEVPKPAEASPRVEADPARPSQALPPPPVRQSPPPMPFPNGSSGSPFGRGLTGLLCLAIPALAIIVLLKSLAAGKSATFPQPPAQPRPASPPGLPVTPERIPHPQVRLGTDGFWLNGDWPVGTTLRLHYLLQSVPTDTELIYRPGPEGQFVYTGTTPQSVSAVAVSGETAPGSLLDPPPLHATPPPLHARPSPGHRAPVAAPPFTPGAY